MFLYLAERLVQRLETPYPTDLSPECCGMLSTLCLAQVHASISRQPPVVLLLTASDPPAAEWVHLLRSASGSCRRAFASQSSLASPSCDCGPRLQSDCGRADVGQPMRPQAQECFYTKAAADRKSPALLARIAAQVRGPPRPGGALHSKGALPLGRRPVARHDGHPAPAGT